MKPKNFAAVGLDIGSYSLKCVEIARSQQEIKLNRVSIYPLLGMSPQDVRKAIQYSVDAEGASKRIRISVSGSSLLIRRISLPSMTHAELKGAIRFEAESHIPFPIDDCILDFQILNQTAVKKTMDVLLVAAKKDYVQERLKLLSDISIQPELIDVDIFCLMNAFEVLADGQADSRSYGILNIGHVVSSFAIIHDKQPFFVREIPVGAQGVTKALADSNKITEDEADALKVAAAPEDAEALRAATQKGFEPLIDEIRHSIDYFENEAGEELKAIWMSGGGALSLGAPELLTEELGHTVSLWDNMKKMQVFGDLDQKFLASHSAELNVALGMALRGLGNSK